MIQPHQSLDGFESRFLRSFGALIELAPLLVRGVRRPQSPITSGEVRRFVDRLDDHGSSFIRTESPEQVPATVNFFFRLNSLSMYSMTVDVR